MAAQNKKKKTSKKTTKQNKKRVPTKVKKTSIQDKMAKHHPRNHMSDEVWNFILAAFTFFIAVVVVSTQFGHGGWLGEYVKSGATQLVGPGYWILFSSLFLLLSYSFFRELDRDFHPMKVFGSILFLLSGLGAIELVLQKGGWAGSLLAELQNPIGYPMALLFMLILFVISLALILDSIPFVSSWGAFDDEEDDEDEEYTGRSRKKSGLSDEEDERISAATRGKGDSEKTGEKPAETSKQPVLAVKKKSNVPSEKEADKLETNINQKIRESFANRGAKIEKSGVLSDNSMIPPISLLAQDKGRPEVGDIKASANTIKRTLANFGIDVEMGEVEVGPTVTRYAFKPAEGVKLARIAGLKDDLALALAARALRMETPIPGKALVGIEIPNKNSTMVGFGTLLNNVGYTDTAYKLPLALGKNIAGEPAYIDLAKAPHMLIAGATGAGKSVTVHALINSMLFKYGPDMLKFIMVDPKRVEMTLYNGIPHLLTPVITDAKSSILALKWAVKEMNRRYDVLQEHAVRDIASYHENVVGKYKAPEDVEPEDDANAPERMPYIVVVIDELADIMQAYPRELESGIVQLAQMSRAVGIHLIISTQRPSVNVITGLIKANVPTRIALQVASAVDSRTILDMGGAEQLLGKGDMLYMTGEMSKPVRVQCAFLSEDEVKKVVSWIKKTYKGEVPEEIDLSTKAVADVNTMFAGEINKDDEEDDLYEDAKAAVIEAGKASTSYIQRRLRVGYSRAARLMDILEERGVIGPADGSKPREILEGAEGDTEGDTTVSEDDSNLLSS